MKSVVFVDDEANILHGLGRMLRPMRKEWDMHFFERGRDALDFVETNGCDVIVSDMRMPNMDGVELLSGVKSVQPDTIRIALSGQADATLIYRCISYAHQYLAKPCAPKTLTGIVQQACTLRSRLADPAMRRHVSKISSLPSKPGSYEEIMGELQSREGSLARVAKIIENDIAMSTKVLQLVNSAYFGAPEHVASPFEAAQFLGLDVIKVLALSFGIFSEHQHIGVDNTKLNDIWCSSMHVGRIAYSVSLQHGLERNQAELAMTAGMLCDIGLLVLLSSDDGVDALRRVAGSFDALGCWQQENDLHGFNHMDIGAYLAALWGLPGSVVDTIGAHHAPAQAAMSDKQVLAAVHIASAVVDAGGDESRLALDESFLQATQAQAWLQTALTCFRAS